MVYSDREKKLIRQFLRDLEALKNAHPNKRFNLTLGLQVSYEHMLDMEKEREEENAQRKNVIQIQRRKTSVEHPPELRQGLRPQQ